MKHFIRIAVVLLVAGVCFGQMSARKKLFGVRQNSAPAFPLAGLANRWIASNEPAGAITNWTDLVGGAKFITTAAELANAVTNDTKGVRFVANDNRYLTSERIGGTHTNWSAAILMEVAVGPSPSSPTALWVNYLTTFNYRGMGIQLYSNFTFTVGAADFYNNVSTNILGPNIAVDYVLTLNNGIVLGYTNGVLSFSNVTSGASTQNTNGYNTIGWKFGGIGYNGWVREMMLWTNGALTSNDVYNIHWYRTNTYGGTP